MSEKPIIFSTREVQAIIAGKKTVTRRPVRWMAWSGFKEPGDAFEVRTIPTRGLGVFFAEGNRAMAGEIVCPYGRPFRPGFDADRLWVRETWTYVKGAGKRLVYRADGDPPRQLYYPGFTITGMKWIPSSQMPRELSRITLDITDVRVERLQTITERDIDAEGLPIDYSVPDHPHQLEMEQRAEFVRLWDKQYARTVVHDDCREHRQLAVACRTCRGATFESNPFVWVIAFRPLEQPAALKARGERDGTPHRLR